MTGPKTRLLPVLACVVAAACAPVPATRPVAQPGTVTQGGGTRPAQPPPSRAVVDSGPSADAQAVLATIPEPIDSADRVPAPAPADSEGDVPIPQETAPLGQTGGNDSLFAAPNVAAPSSGGAPSGGASSGGSGAGAAAGGAAAGTGSAAKTAPPKSSGPCYRVQIAAPDNAPEASGKRDAATSLLLVPFVVEKEGGLFKVRSRDCLDDAAATRLRDRAVNNGFDGAFKLKGTK